MDDSSQTNSQDNATFSFDDNGTITDDVVAMADTTTNVQVEIPGDPTSPSTIQADTQADFPERGLLSTSTEQEVLSATDDRTNTTTTDESPAQSGASTTSAGQTTVDVSVGGGMIEVISKAKGISMAEAEKVYYSMKSKGQISSGIPGTYDMSNQDIGISAPGAFVVGEDLMADIDTASGNTHRPQQETSDVLGQTDRPQEATSSASGADTSTSTVDRSGINVDRAPRSIIDTRIAPFPSTPNDL